jgi:hypothetical protein
VTWLERFRTLKEGYEYDILQAFYNRRGWPPEAIWYKESAWSGMALQCIVPNEGTEEVGYVGLHATLARREVFEKLLGKNDPETFAWFWYPREKVQGEDMAWSDEARKAGFRMGATTLTPIGHIGEIVTDRDTHLEWLRMSGITKRIERMNELVSLVSTFTGEPQTLVMTLALQGNEIVKTAWNQVKPKTAMETRKFYGHKKSGYLYDLVGWNSTPFYEEITKGLHDVHGQKALVVGGGIGGEAAILAKDSNQVDVFELEGVLKEFLQFRLGEQIHVLDGDRLSTAIRGNPNYDLAVAVDVIEHIHPEEWEDAMGTLARAIRAGGILYAHNNFEQEGFPQHYDHADRFEGWCERYGFKQESNYVWRKSS